MTFTGDIGPRVISDGLILCMDPVSPKCREENNFMNLVTKNEIGWTQNQQRPMLLLECFKTGHIHSEEMEQEELGILWILLL